MHTALLQNRLPPALALAPFSCDELSSFRRLGRQAGHFQALAHAAMRLQVLRTFRSAGLGPEAAAGAEMAEDAALAALGRCPCPDREGLRLKRALFGSRQAHGDNLEAMLAASVAADETRLDAEDAAARRHRAALRTRVADGRPGIGPA